MFIDQPNIVEGSSIINATVPNGTVSDPSLPSIGELFFRTDLNALRVFNGSIWEEAGASALATHAANLALHLTSAQNTLLDGLNLPTLTATHLNFVAGVTSNIQTQFNTQTTNLSNHIADLNLHLTASQNTLLDGLSGTLTSAHLNFVEGATSNIQSQLNAANSVDTTQNTRLTTLENTTVPAVQTNLTSHINDNDKHLTTTQNTLLDGITVTFTEVNRLTGVTSNIQPQINTLSTEKISRDGSIAMTGTLAMGTNRIINLGTPTQPTDAATKDYVDQFVAGIHWAASVKAATTGNITLSGTQTIDTRPLSVGDRVLVKNQTNQAENGIYIVASGAWTRANDSNAPSELNNSAVFVLEYAGATQSKSTWIQTSDVVTVGTSPITYSAFSGPVVNTAGSGISLGPSGTVAVNEGAGLGFDGNGALVVDLHPSGGLMVTTNNTTAATITTVAAQLALTQTGVTAGTYNNSATTVQPFTIDSKGRVTNTGTVVTITPAFSSITGKPTTLSGYGITDAQPLDADLTSIASLAGTSGLLRKTAVNTWVLDNSAFLTANQTITLSGDVSGSGSTTISTTLASVGTAGTYRSVTTDAKGRVTAGTNPTTIAGYGLTDAVKTDGSIPMTGNLVWNGNNIGLQWNDSTDFARIYLRNSGLDLTSFVFELGDNGAVAGQDAFIWRGNGIGGGAPTQDIMKLDSSGLYVFNNAVLTSGNFNTYAPTLTGGGASGTWGINISGSAPSLVGSPPILYSTAASSTSYANRVQMRERAAAGAQGGTSTNAPALAFHWGGLVASQIALEPDGTIAIVDNPGTAYEKFRCSTIITSSNATVGNVLAVNGPINTINGITPPNGAIRLTPNLHLNSSAGNAVIVNWDNGNGGNSGNLAFRVGSGFSADVFTVTYAGTVYANGNITAYSDIRLKEDLEPIKSALQKVSEITGYTYTRKDTGKKETGLIAQEVQKILPEVVEEAQDGTLSLAYGNMAGLLVQALKELNEEVQVLRAEVAALKAAK